MSFVSLPKFILYKIFEQLSFQDICSFEKSCKSLNRLVRGEKNKKKKIKKKKNLKKKKKKK